MSLQPNPHPTKPNPNNINIQINVNVKDNKPRGFTGKKIDNYVEIEEKKQKQDTRINRVDVKKKVEKNKQKKVEISGYKVSNKKKRQVQTTALTPQKIGKSRREQRSKSQSKVNRNRISGKSFDNLKMAYKDRKQKSTSRSPSRQHSQSSKKLIKSTKHSTKNLFGFTNSGIKKKLKKNQSKQKSLHQGTQKIGIQKEDEYNKLKEFMEDKKRRQKKQRAKQRQENKIKKRKIQEELKRVEKQRKENASKPYVIHRTKNQQPQLRLPLVNLEDEDFNESQEYQKLQRQANELIYIEPSNLQALNSEQLHTQPKHSTLNSSSKKKVKILRESKGLVELYKEGNISDLQMNKLEQNVNKIQSFWRACIARIQIRKIIQEQTQYFDRKKQDSFKSNLDHWKRMSSNSIQNFQDEKKSDNNFGSSFEKIEAHSNSERSSQENSSVKKMNKNVKNLKIQVSSEDPDTPKNMPKQKIPQNVLRELEELKRKFESQNQQFRSLQQQNVILKENLKTLSLKESRQIKGQQSMANSSDFVQLRMPQKIETEEKTKEQKVFSTGEKSMNSYKKEFQNFECSPTNARLEQQLKILKAKNLKDIFKNRQIQIDEEFEIKRQVITKQFSQKLVSPRTFNFKKKQLESKKYQEKEIVKQRLQEAKRVVGFIQKIEEVKSQKEQSNKKPQTSQGNQVRSRELSKESYLSKEEQEMSSEEERNYRKYWTEDHEDVHQYTMNNLKKIQEALAAESGSSHNPSSQQYLSQGHQTIEVENKNKHLYSKSQDLNNLKPQIISQDIQPSQQEELSQKKAQQIFNKITNFDGEEECKSEDDESGDIFQLLANSNKLSNSDKSSNLYVSEAEFNKSKRHNEEMSRSSSFEQQKLSNNNSSIVCKGFLTNLVFVKEFCISICEFIRNNNEFLEIFSKQFSTPIKFNSQEYLQSYRLTLEEEINSHYNSFHYEYLYTFFKLITTKSQPISHQLFTKFLEFYNKQNQNNSKWNDPSLKPEAKQLRQFYLISVIDALNESLQNERPCGGNGLPMSWQSNTKVLKNHANKKLGGMNIEEKEEEESQEQQKLDQIFGVAIARLIQWGSCLCGFIADSMPMQDSQIINISDEQVNSIRETRVGLMLEKWLVEEEEKIVDTNEEKTEVKLCLETKITEQLIDELAKELRQFF